MLHNSDSTVMDNELSGHLRRLQLRQYIPLLQENGYTSWNKAMAIKEEDFDRMGFKLGHRRKLQREMANMAGYPQSEPLPSPATEIVQLFLSRPMKISPAFPPTKGNKQLRKGFSKSGAYALKGATTGVLGDFQPSQSTILNKAVLLFVEEGHRAVLSTSSKNISPRPMGVCKRMKVMRGRNPRFVPFRSSVGFLGEPFGASARSSLLGIRYVAP